MKVILEGTEKQLNPIVQMLQGFAISITKVGEVAPNTKREEGITNNLEEDGADDGVSELPSEEVVGTTINGDGAAPEKSAEKKNKSKK